MSLASCRLCGAFVDTDADPDACVGIHFLCEVCRQDWEEQVCELIQLGVSMKEIAMDWQITHPHESAKLFQYGNDIIYDWAKKARGEE